MRPLAFTVVTLASFAALPVIAQEASNPETIQEVVDEVIDPARQAPSPPASALPVTLPDPGAVPAADPQQRLDTPEAVFIADALRSGEMATASARLAGDRTSTLKQLAARVEREQEAINDKLRKLRHADAATEPGGQPVHPEMARLEMLEGDAFDAAWLAVEETHFRTAVEKFERASTSQALDLEVRSASAEVLVTLRALLAEITAVKGSLGY